MSSSEFNADFQKLSQSQECAPCAIKNGRLIVPDNPVICYIDGDGIGAEIGPPSRRLIDITVQKISGEKRHITWLKLYAGEEALSLYGERLPDDTLNAIHKYRLCLKGPLATPVGTGYKSLNVAIRQKLNLYANVRPFNYIPGVPSPVRHPEEMDMILFRENTEDVYAGIEWPPGSPQSRRIIDFILNETGISVPGDAGIGIKIISSNATKQLIRLAIEFALSHRRRSVTFVTKGNIMKFTEGAFRTWAYEVACEEYGDFIVTEASCGGRENAVPPGKLLIKDRLADDMLQQVLLHPQHYDVIATPNLNGDYLSDALAAQVGGVAMAAGANLGNTIGVFEPVHGTAPAIAGRNSANPTGMILSGAMMLEYMGWNDVASALKKAVSTTIASGRLTMDLAKEVSGATPLSTTGYVEAIAENI